MASLFVWVYTQPNVGTRGESYVTTIATPSEKRPEAGTKASLQLMINSIRAEACAGNVSDHYIRGVALIKNTILMVMYTERVEEYMTPSSRRAPSVAATRSVKDPLGFICARPDDVDPTGFYIDVICAKSQGTALLMYFIEYARLANARFVGLSSLPSVLAFYPKFGFEFRKSCEGDPLAILPDTIPTLLTDMKRSGRPMPRTSMNTYDLEPYADFMIQLHDLGLTVKKDGVCGKAKLNKDELKTGDCGMDGFTMKKCFPLASGGTRRKRKARRQSRKH